VAGSQKTVISQSRIACLKKSDLIETGWVD
jgi:hypothetical protein